MAATASGRISDPVKAVNVPAALMNERTPSSSITSRPFAGLLGMGSGQSRSAMARQASRPGHRVRSDV